MQNQEKPNILFFMVDQMQGRVLDDEHPCLTPHFDRLKKRGVRFKNAYTPNAVCSPARASLMTGLLPHSHGVTAVTHSKDGDQLCLREDRAHWAELLQKAGYTNGYFGKWHIERSNELHRFGWNEYVGHSSKRFNEAVTRAREATPDKIGYVKAYHLEHPGYRKTTLYGVTSHTPEQRGMGIATQYGLDFIERQAQAGEGPWCCFISTTEPHDPFVCGEKAYQLYDAQNLEIPENWNDTLENRPNIYRRSAGVFAEMTEEEKREAAVCYYASITELDEQLGKLVAKVESLGQLDNTIIVVTSDHGELLGAHQQYCKNFTAFEEIYNIPMLISGPGIVADHVSDARMGLHDFYATMMTHLDIEFEPVVDSRSFQIFLESKEDANDEWTQGYAEYTGNRFEVTQRVMWDGDWKLVFNGFDFDELYDLASDPQEMCNRIDYGACLATRDKLYRQMWKRVRETDDHSVLNTNYPPYRFVPVGPQE